LTFPFIGLFRYAKFPSKLIGFVLVLTNFPFTIIGQRALQWSGNHWKLWRRLTVGIGNWTVAIFFIRHGAFKNLNALNAFSKKLENLKAACALHFAWYNFCRVHSSLRVTPAVAAGVTTEVWPLTSLLV